MNDKDKLPVDVGSWLAFGLRSLPTPTAAELVATITKETDQ